MAAIYNKCRNKEQLISHMVTQLGDWNLKQNYWKPADGHFAVLNVLTIGLMYRRRQAHLKITRAN